MTIDVSIVIPTVGRRALARAIASCAAQWRQPREVIVVDNGPRPGADERSSNAAQVLEGRVPLKWITLPPASGPSLSRNVGAWNARSSHIAFLDDDDELEAGYLAAIATRISAERPDVLYGMQQLFDAQGRLVRTQRLTDVPSDAWRQRLYRHYNHGFGGNFVVRRDTFFRLGGFPTDLRTAEDRAFAIAALRGGSDIAFVEEAVVRCHDSGANSAQRDAGRWIAWLKITSDNWDDMTAGTKLVASARTGKAMLGHVRRRRARHPPA